MSAILHYHHSELVNFLREVRGNTSELNFINSKSKEWELLHLIINSKEGFLHQKKTAGDMHVKPPQLRKKIQPNLNKLLKTFSYQCNLNPPIQLYFSTQESYIGGHFACCKVEDNASVSMNFISLEDLHKGLKFARQRLMLIPSIPDKTMDTFALRLFHAVPVVSHFVGRLKEIDFLNATLRLGKVHSAGIIAWGGFGKSVLVRQWIEEIYRAPSDFVKPKIVLWWSFYQNNSVDAFVESAVLTLTAQEQRTQNLYNYIEEKFDRLISLLGERPSILVLDGLEEMQYSQSGDYFGKCKNYQLANFIRRICEGDCPGCLCVITSRLPVNDLSNLEGNTYKSINLEEMPLHVEEARLLLRKHGVKGSDDLLDEIIIEHGAHPLALVTIATLLSNYYKGDAREVNNMPSVAIPKSTIGDRYKLWRTFAWYDSLLKPSEQVLLRVISVFRQIAPWRLLMQLIKSGDSSRTINDLNKVSETEIKAIVFHLDQLQLIRYDQDSDAYYMHPLWKHFFESSIDTEVSIFYHKLLFDILQKDTPYNPDTLSHMWPLIEAVYHGCKCGYEKESLNIFRERIERKTGYLTKILCAWETKVDLCSMFFSNKHFKGQCILRELEEQGHLLNAAGFAYMNMGLPVKAIPLLEKAINVYTQADLNNDKGQVYRNLSDAKIRIGCIDDAIEAAMKAADLDLSTKSQQSSLGYLGYAYALLGNYGMAESAFEKAKSLHGQDWLPPIRGVQYVEMLIMSGQYNDAVLNARKMFDWIKTQNILFSEAECARVLSAALYEKANALIDHQAAHEAVSLINQAVALATKAGVHYYIVRTNLDSARIKLLSLIQRYNILEETNINPIQVQMREILRISKESNYRIIEAEALYINAHLYFFTKQFSSAQEELERAINLAREVKYRWLELKCIDLQNKA